MNTEKTLVLQGDDGKVLRSYAWQGQPVQVIRRGDTRRLEVLSNTDELTKNKIPFEKLGDIKSRSELENKPLLVGKLGHLRLVEGIESTHKDLQSSKESERRWYYILAAVLLIAMALITFILARSHEPSAKMEEALKQEVVKIVKSIPPKQKVELAATMNKEQEVAAVQPKTKTSLKRMGALAALGSLSKSKQRGGLDLGAANTTAGPGLGGTEGSGGVQTSLYAKGVTSAALGAGGNVQGGGGYGTKGKGGGQAGYGKLSLIGSAGDSAIPLGNEATVETGLDKDMIAAVINRNQGQIRFCYEQGLQGTPSLNGRVAVDWTIGGNGLVKAAGIGSSSLNSKIVEDCIVMRLKTWKFPLPQGGVDVKVSYPFVLRRAGQG